MKHLKRYNEAFDLKSYYNPQELIYDLEDMVSDLQDDNIVAQVKLHTNTKIELGDILKFKRRFTEQYREDKGPYDYSGDIFSYTFDPEHEFRVVRYENKYNYFITNITTNDGHEFISRSDIRELVKKKYKTQFEVYMYRPGEKNDWITWSEIKDTVIRITEYCYDKGLLVSFSGNARVLFMGFKNEEDFKDIDDGSKYMSLRMHIYKQ